MAEYYRGDLHSDVDLPDSSAVVPEYRATARRIENEIARLKRSHAAGRTMFQFKGEIVDVDLMGGRDSDSEWRALGGLIRNAIRQMYVEGSDLDWYGESINSLARRYTADMWRDKFGWDYVTSAGDDKPQKVVVGRRRPRFRYSATMEEVARKTCAGGTLKWLREVVRTSGDYTVQEYTDEAGFALGLLAEARGESVDWV